MFERFSRSWALIKASASVLQKDKELLVFPAVSSVAAIIVAASFLAPLFLMLQGNPEAFESRELSPVWYVWAFAFYMTQYFVIFFFNTALVGAASIRLEGGDPTVADGLRIAWSKVGTILGYAAIAATVGMILRAIEERAGWIGKWVAGLLGAAWTVVTFMVVPILVHRDIGPMDAVKESAKLLKETWGENLIGQGGVGLVFGLIQFGLWALVGFLAVATVATKSVGLVITVLVIGFLASLILALLQSALAGIYSAALYRYAVGHVNAPEFSGELLQRAFAVKGALSRAMRNPAGLAVAMGLVAAAMPAAAVAAPASTWGATITVVAITLVVILLCVLLHYEGLTLLQRQLGHAGMGPRRMRVLIGIFGVLLMHAFEILFFACGYAAADFFPAAGGIGGIGENGHHRLLDLWYFSAITYTTVGYGDLAPVGALRFMAAAESLAGFVLVSWSASFTYLVMERYWGQRR